MRPLEPLPFTSFRSQPNSREKRRTDGLAKTGLPNWGDCSETDCSMGVDSACFGVGVLDF